MVWLLTFVASFTSVNGASATFTMTDLPAVAEYEKLYTIGVGFSYSWSVASERPLSGANLILYEFDNSFEDSEIYGQRLLAAPLNASTNTAVWTNGVTFTNIDLVDLAGSDDTNDVLQVRARLTVQTSIGATNFDSVIFIKNIQPGIPRSIVAPPTSDTGNYAVSWGTAKGAKRYELQESTNRVNWLTVTNGTNLFWTPPTPRPNGSTNYHRVRAASASAPGDWLTNAFGVVVRFPNQPPSQVGPIAVTNIIATAATAIWGAATDPERNPITYEVLAAPTNALGPATSFGTTTNLSRRITDLTSDTVYRVWVVARDSLGDATSREAASTFQTPPFHPPTIDLIPDQTTLRNQDTPPISYRVSDTETASTALAISVSSSNKTLVPDANILFGGGGLDRKLIVRPAPDRIGTTSITVSVKDEDQLTATATFLLRVMSPPTIASIASQRVPSNGTLTVNLNVTDSETPDAITVTARSDNPGLVHNSNIRVEGSGSAFQLFITPEASRSGTTQITVVARDGDNDQSASSFPLVVFENVPEIRLGFGPQTVPRNGSTGPLSFLVNHPTDPAGTLIVQVQSSNPNLVPLANLMLGGSDTNRTIAASLSPDQLGTSDITLTVFDSAGSTASTNFVVRTRERAPPTISIIPDQTTGVNTHTTAATFTVQDGETSAAGLRINWVSSNRELIPEENIVILGTDGTRRVVALPSANRTGTAVITLYVIDADGNSTSASFRVTVEAPVVSAALGLVLGFGDQTVRLNRSTPPLPLAIVPRPNSTNLFTLTAQSSNPIYLPETNIVFGGSGTNRTVTVTPVTNRIESATVTLTVADSAGFSSRATFHVRTIEPANPTISAITNMNTVRNQSSPIAHFTVADADTPPELLTVSAVSTNQILVPSTNIFVSSSGTNRSIVVTPAAEQVGTTLITVTVRDDDNRTANTSFRLNVLSPPSISPIPNQVMAFNRTNVVAFTVADRETPATNLIVRANSNNTGLVPNSTLMLSGTGALRQLTITPLRDRFGPAEITITAIDSETNQFQLTFLLSVLEDQPSIRLGFGDQTILRNSQTEPLPFAVSHPTVHPAFLTVEGNSSNTNFVPNPNIVFGGSGASRTVIVSPRPNQAGIATITLSVRDPFGIISSTNFVIRTPDAMPPSISAIAIQSTSRNGATLPIIFSIEDSETPPNQLRVIGTSSNKDLVPDQNIVITGSENGRQVVIKPQPDRSGTTTITVTVTDGDNNKATSSFLLTVLDQPPGLILGFGDQVIQKNGATSPLAFKIMPRTNYTGPFRVTARSSHQTFVPDANIRLDGAGTNRTVTVSPALGQSGSTVVTLTVSDSEGLFSEASFTVRTTDPTPPIISKIADRKTSINVTTAPIPFTIGDLETLDSDLRLTATSSNDDLVQNSNILFSGSGTNRSLIVTPMAGRIGFARITVNVIDRDEKTASTSFILTVEDNTAPTISNIADQTTPKNLTTAPIPFTVTDLETPRNSLRIAAQSGNPRLVPEGNIIVSSAGTNQALVITPARNQIGTALITVTVSDPDLKSAATTFSLTVKPTLPLRGDLNGDTQLDVLFRNDDGYLAAWLMDGPKLKSAEVLSPSHPGDPNWQVVGQDDFDGDKREDLLFQHRDGTLAIWLMKGTTLSSVAFPNPNTPGDPDWRVVGLGDFNGDEQTDLVFQHRDGTLAVWYMNGLTLSSGELFHPSQAGDGWRVVGTGDFGLDGKTDLLFQHTDGTLAIWLMDGSNLIQASLLNPKSPGSADWRVASLGDFNQDGHPDLLFQNSKDGGLALWFMQGINLSKTTFLSPSSPGGSWKVIPH